MSAVGNKGFMMRCKSVTALLFTVVGPTIKQNQTAIVIRETPLHKYLSISYPPMAVTTNLPIIPHDDLFNFPQNCMANSSSSSSSDHDL